MNPGASWVKLSSRACWALIAALLLGLLQASQASELNSTSDFAEIANVVEKAVAKYGAEHVLLALDIDNTIMSMDYDLGSDHWFEWQRYLLENEPQSSLLVASSFEGLLDAQGLLYEKGSMHPPQPQQPSIIAKLQRLGIATILLTSRGPEFRSMTERELKRCGYDFSITALKVPNATNETFLPYDPSAPERDGLTNAEIALYNLSDPRPVSYENGLFMTAGQHKGAMLLTLLADSPREIKAVIYADDNLRHVGSVFSAANARGIDIGSFQYRAEEKRVQRFNYSDKSDVHLRWKAIVTAETSGAISQSDSVAVLERSVSPSRRKVVTRRHCCSIRRCR